MNPDVSIVIRTLNEAQYLHELLMGIKAQKLGELSYEVIIVDSGSTDATLEIAQRHACRILHIAKKDFSFGRSLNVGCEASLGKFLVFVSGHCIPVDEHWIKKLIKPMQDGISVMTYGGQRGDERSRFSERQLFKKYFPEQSKIPQKGFFCNNANSALLKEAWLSNRFDEDLTGLEDMELGKRLNLKGESISYVADAAVFHYHYESWLKVRKRYAREAIALRHIMPEIHISFLDFLRYFLSAVTIDCGVAIEEGQFWKQLKDIVLFRFMQFWGSFRGNQVHRKLSRKQKEEYFFPA